MTREVEEAMVSTLSLYSTHYTLSSSIALQTVASSQIATFALRLLHWHCQWLMHELVVWKIVSARACQQWYVQLTHCTCMIILHRLLIQSSSTHVCLL